jgi:hypothetical protein
VINRCRHVLPPQAFRAHQYL